MFGYYISELEEKIDDLEELLILKENEEEYCKEEIDGINKYLSIKEDIYFSKIMSSIVFCILVGILFIGCYFSSISPLFSAILKVCTLVSSIWLSKKVYKEIIKKSKYLKSTYSCYLNLSDNEITDMLNNLKQKEENLSKEVNNIYNDLDTYYVELGVIKDCRSNLENSVNVPYLHADSKEEYKMFVSSCGENLENFKEFLIDSRKYSSFSYDYNSGYKEGPKTKQLKKNFSL